MAEKQIPKKEVKPTGNELTLDIINELKASNPRGIYKVVVMEDVFVIRTLNRDEYVDISNEEDTSVTEKEEIITATCVVWPQITLKEVEKLPAGAPTTLAEQIMLRSGFEAVSVEKL